MGLPISTVVNVSVTISPAAPPKQGFGTPGLVTDELDLLGAIQVPRIRFYGSISEIAVDWATTSETYKSALAYFSQSPSPVTFSTISQDSVGGESEVDALSAAELASPNWYGVLLLAATRDTQVQLDVAAWTEARTKVFSTVTENLLTLTLGDVANNAYALFNSNYTRTMCIFSSNAGEYADSAALGKALTTNFNAPDSVITLKFKSLAGISTEDIDTGDKASLDEKRCNVFANVGGANMFMEGYMSSQLFFDERHSVDWLTGEIQSNVFGFLVTRTTKVPYTDKGTATIEQQVVRALDAGVSNGMLAPGETSIGEFLGTGYKVIVQKVADVSASDKAARIAPAVTFTALLAGALHFIQINGTVER